MSITQLYCKNEGQAYAYSFTCKKSRMEIKSFHLTMLWQGKLSLFSFCWLFIFRLVPLAGHDCSIRLWNLGDKTCIQEFTAHRKKFQESIHDVAFHPTKCFIASAGADALAKVFVWPGPASTSASLSLAPKAKPPQDTRLEWGGSGWVWWGGRAMAPPIPLCAPFLVLFLSLVIVSQMSGLLTGLCRPADSPDRHCGRAGT